jgi:predicted ATP-grasp superfamily ATP-dependent carboligase
MKYPRELPRSAVSPRVLLTDADERYVLAATRGLGRQGFRVTAVTGRRPAVAQWSRWCDRGGRVTDPHIDPERFVVDLERLLRATRHAITIPGGEAALLAISAQRDRLEPLTRLGLPPHDVVRSCLDKLSVNSVAADVGLAPPPSIPCTDLLAAEAAATHLGFPLMVKPARSEIPADSGSHHQPSMLVTSPSELPAAVGKAGPSFAIQRFEPDTRTISFAGVATRTGLLATAVSLYERTWPPQAGSAAASVSASPPPGLVAPVEALLSRLGWEGIFELELLRYPDGHFAAIDFNPRVYGSMTLAIDAGANLPAVWCRHLLGLPASRATARPGVRYRWEEGEARTIGWLLARRRYSDLAHILRAAPPEVYAHVRLSDPVPSLVRGSWLLLRGIRRLLFGARSPSGA